MKLSIGFLKEAKKHFQVIKIPKHHVYEYATNLPEGVVFNVLEVENDIVNDLDDSLIGKFGIDFQDKIIAYYLS